MPAAPQMLKAYLQLLGLKVEVFAGARLCISRPQGIPGFQDMKGGGHVQASGNGGNGEVQIAQGSSVLPPQAFHWSKLSALFADFRVRTRFTWGRE